MEVILVKYENHDDKYVDWEYDTKHCVCVVMILLLRLSFILTHTVSNFLSVHMMLVVLFWMLMPPFCLESCGIFCFVFLQIRNRPVIVRIHPGPY